MLLVGCTAAGSPRVPILNWGPSWERSWLGHWVHVYLSVHQWLWEFTSPDEGGLTACFVLERGDNPKGILGTERQLVFSPCLLFMDRVALRPSAMYVHKRDR